MAITLRLSDKEEEILTSYAKQNKRSKSDILREYIRSLGGQKQAEVAEELPEGWMVVDTRGKDGGYLNYYREYKRILLHVCREEDYYEVWFFGVIKGRIPLTVGLKTALTAAKQLVDKVLIENQP